MMALCESDAGIGECIVGSLTTLSLSHRLAVAVGGHFVAGLLRWREPSSSLAHQLIKQSIYAMVLFLSILRSNRLSPRIVNRGYRKTNERFSKPTTSNDTKKGVEIDESNLKWTERKEAPKWLSRMAPTKGGTKLPNPLEAAVISVFMAAGYYAWFVDPPKRAAEVAEGQR